MNRRTPLTATSAFKVANTVFAKRTLLLMWFDLLRLRARRLHPGRQNVVPRHDKLHVSCGGRRVPAARRARAHAPRI